MEVFTQPWVDRFRQEINCSESYRHHGATWEAPIALEMSFRGRASPRTIVLHLHQGSCESAHCADSVPDEVQLIIRTDVVGWQRILAGKMDPIWGIMSGKLRLVRGSLTELVPYALAAKALVDSAAQVEATFPPQDGP